jgi:serine/threonine protein phosphatase PrpC
VFALQDEPEVPRVWLPFDDAPGLAMARAFGDFCLKEYGVISVPDFFHCSLSSRDQFVVLASDGVCLFFHFSISFWPLFFIFSF